jgi:hypothetical protein
LVPRTIWIHTALLAGYVALALIHTYPLVRHLHTHLPGLGLGDNVSFVWNLWWMREALSSPSSEFFTSPLIAAPLGVSLALHTHTALTAFLGATVLAPFPVVAAQNILLIASLVVNGMGAYTLSWVVSRARGPSIIAGALLLIASPVTTRLMGHYNLVLVGPLAFACAAYVVWCRTPSIATATLLAVTAALIPYGDYYYAIFFGVFAIAYGAFERWDIQVNIKGRPRSRIAGVLLSLAALAMIAGAAIALLPAFELRAGPLRLDVNSPTNVVTAAWLLLVAGLLVQWSPQLQLTPHRTGASGHIRSLLPGSIVFAVLLAPLILPVWELLTSGGYVTQTSALKSSSRGVDVASLALGPPFGGLAGPFVRRAYQALGLDVMESSAWLGVIPLLLLGLGLRRSPPSIEIRRWLTIATLFGIWALGPYLTVLGYKTGLLLPQALAYVVPFLNNARIPGRAMAVCVLAVMVVISLTLSSSALSRRTLWMLLALAIVESIGAPLPLTPLPRAGIDADIAAGRSGTVLTVPFGVRDGFGEKGLLMHDALYGQTIHGKAIAGGFVARLPPDVWSWYDDHEPFRTLLMLSTPGVTTTALPACEEIADGLRAASVAHLVVYRHAVSPALRTFLDRMPVRPVSQDDQRVLFAVDPTPPRPCGSSTQ